MPTVAKAAAEGTPGIGGLKQSDLGMSGWRREATGAPVEGLAGLLSLVGLFLPPAWRRVDAT